MFPEFSPFTIEKTTKCNHAKGAYLLSELALYTIITRRFCRTERTADNQPVFLTEQGKLGRTQFKGDKTDVFYLGTGQSARLFLTNGKRFD